MGVTWLGETHEGATVVFRVGREGDRLVAEWPGLVSVDVARDGTDLHVVPQEGADARQVAKLRASTIPALLRHLEGKLTLHASAVTAHGKAVAFLGDSGRGKSTIAFELANTSGAFALLADDCLRVEGICAEPFDEVAWIDRASAKTPLRPARVARSAAPIAAIFLLEWGDQLRVSRLKGNAVGAVLERALIRFVLDEPTVHVADLERLGNLASQVPVYELRRPRDVSYFPATIVELERRLSSDNL